MKKLLTILMLCAAFGPLAKADINFMHGPWAEVLAKANQEKKLVFVDAYTTWCGPCKWMSANTFTNPEVADFFNANFINAKIDMEHDEGPGLQVKYHVTAYPTLLFISGNGELFHVAVGALDAAGFLKLGREVLDPKFLSITVLKSRFAAGETDPKFLADYIMAMKTTGEDYKPALEKFEPGMAGAALLEEHNWRIFQAIFVRKDSKPAQYFLSHLSDFEAKYGEQAVQGKAMQIYSAPVLRATYNDKADDYAIALKELKKCGLKEAKQAARFYEMEWDAKHDLWDDYLKLAKAIVKETPDIQPTQLNSFAWKIYTGCTKTKDLETGLTWINKACDADPNYFFLDTKAMLLMKLGRKSEAIAVCKMAIEKGTAAGEDVSSTQEALDEMEGQ